MNWRGAADTTQDNGSGIIPRTREKCAAAAIFPMIWRGAADTTQRITNMVCNNEQLLNLGSKAAHGERCSEEKCADLVASYSH